ncbi:MAG TPA: rRNA maturation RNase YbeY [Patescibacteria group bacterium]|nr:rRNA maturation RNase YbeY [Patescibacteria group bacterium]
MSNPIVLIFVESRYKVNRKRMKATVAKTLDEQSVMTPVEVSVAIVGDRKMKVLNKKYRDKEETTNVLSFSLAEGKKMQMASGIVKLGDIVISYPQVIKEAVVEEVLVDEKVDELLAHGLRHLLGIHH